MCGTPEIGEIRADDTVRRRIDAPHLLAKRPEEPLYRLEIGHQIAEWQEDEARRTRAIDRHLAKAHLHVHDGHLVLDERVDEASYAAEERAGLVCGKWAHQALRQQLARYGIARLQAAVGILHQTAVEKHRRCERAHAVGKTAFDRFERADRICKSSAAVGYI